MGYLVFDLLILVYGGIIVCTGRDIESAFLHQIE